jgi:hypothetical protein
MDEQEKDSRPRAMNLEWMLENHPETIPDYINVLKGIIGRYRSALFFIDEHMKAGKAWDQECEKVIGEALRPKPPKGLTGESESHDAYRHTTE